MAIFSYKAVTPEGKVAEGTLEAMDEQSALQRLREQDQIPIRVFSGKSGLLGRELKLPWQRKRLPKRDLLLFTQELSTLVRAGLPLDRSLTILSELTENEYLREIIRELLREIKAGKSLSEALAAHPQVFPRVYISMIKAGEIGGALDEILKRLEEYLRSAEDLRSYLKTSLIYPCILIVVLGSALIFLFSFVVPRFAVVFENAGAPVPLPMRIMLAISGLITGYWWLFVGVVLAAGFLFRRWVSSEEGRLSWDRRLLKLPLLGAVMEKAEVSRLARALGTMLNSAVPLIPSINIAKDIVSNLAFVTAMEPIKSGVKKGDGLVKPVKEAGIFPPFAIHLLQVGEETGQLDAMLLQIADTYDRELRVSFQRLMAFFEPAVIVIMGLVVGVVVVSILYSIVSINDIPL